MLVPLVELSRYSVRQTVGFTDFIDYANTPWQMLAVVFPAIAHHGLEAPTYVGLAVLLCALVGAVQLPIAKRAAENWFFSQPAFDQYADAVIAHQDMPDRKSVV